MMILQDCSGEIKATTNKVVSVNRTNRVDIRQSGFSDIIDEIFENSVKIQIDNKVTTCKKDIEVCCKKTPTPSTTTIQIPIKGQDSPKPPLVKCGVHNAEGLEVTASDPSDGKAR